MNIPMKYEDVVAQLDAALGREAALREELSTLADDYCEKVDDLIDLQQRLTVAEQWAGVMVTKLGDAYEWGYGDGQNSPNGYSSKEDRDKCVTDLMRSFEADSVKVAT